MKKAIKISPHSPIALRAGLFHINSEEKKKYGFWLLCVELRASEKINMGPDFTVRPGVNFGARIWSQEEVLQQYRHPHQPYVRDAGSNVMAIYINSLSGNQLHKN